MADFPNIPCAAQTSQDSEPLVKETRYGGGFRQSTQDGPNNVLPVWEVLFENRPWADWTTARNFWKSKGGATTFTWDPPEPELTDRGTLKVKCKKWNIVWASGHMVTFRATYEEVVA